MKSLKTILPVIFFALPFVANAQIDGTDDFDNFMKEETREFNKFIDEANREFIQFLRDPWKDETPKEPKKALDKPKPTAPPVATGVPVPTQPVAAKPTPIVADKAKPVEEDPDFDFGDNSDVIKAKQPGSVKPLETKNKPVAKPAAPAKPEVPATPVAAAKPTAPEKPATPETPAAATKPAAPATPVAAAKPAAPTAPAAKPAAPATPVAAAKPATPVSTPTPVPAAPTAAAVTALASLDSYRSQSIFAGGGNRVKMSFLGTTLYVSGALRGKCSVASTTPDGVADAVQTLASSDYKGLVEDINSARKYMKLNGWATYLLVNDIAKQFASSANEQVVLRLFLLNELGFKSQIGQAGSTLVLLVAPDVMVYDVPYVGIGGQNFYDVDKKLNGAFKLCSKLSPKATKAVDMHITTLPALDTTTKPSTHAFAQLGASVTANVANSQMNLYQRYPQCDFSVYVKAPVSPTVAQPALNALRPLIQGKSETEAANIILTYCQKAFEYKTDDDQFGYEKPFFVEELFFHPYSDCEDRSILFQYLVRNLLKLEVVLLDYPNHIATGVKFNSAVNGDKVTSGSTTYLVCDPTYIGASIGMAQPSFKNVKPEVLKF